MTGWLVRCRGVRKAVCSGGGGGGGVRGLCVALYGQKTVQRYNHFKTRALDVRVRALLDAGCYSRVGGR